MYILFVSFNLLYIYIQLIVHSIFSIAIFLVLLVCVNLQSVWRCGLLWVPSKVSNFKVRSNSSATGAELGTGNALPRRSKRASLGWLAGKTLKQFDASYITKVIQLKRCFIS